jgi:hypothetical protein
VYFELLLQLRSLKEALFENKLIPEQQDYLMGTLKKINRCLLNGRTNRDESIALNNELKQTILFPVWDNIK